MLKEIINLIDGKENILDSFLVETTSVIAVYLGLEKSKSIFSVDKTRSIADSFDKQIIFEPYPIETFNQIKGMMKA